ncbi:MAG: DUF2970 domain-containing protein [Pseudomonadales bacterium]
MSRNDNDSSPDNNSPSRWQVALSVIAAAIGVQSRKNRERDFSHGDPVTFIIAGLIFTVLFVVVLLGIVYLVLNY